MIMTSGSTDIFFGAAQKTMTGTALTASKGAGAVFSMILAGMKGDPSGKGDKAGLSLSLENSLENKANGVMSGGSSVAAKLESVFQTRGISLEKIVLEQGDFEFLGAVLEKMGFSQSRIHQFFKQMMETRSDGSITLADFFKDLTAFEQDEKSGHGIPGSSLSVSLDKSAIPHLELILRDLGVSAEKTNMILANAASENGALDVNKLVFQLKQYAAALEKKVALESNQTSGNRSVGKQTDPNQMLVPSAQKAVAGLFEPGISVSKSDADTPFSLKAFIAALEQKHQGPAHAIKPAAVNTATLTDSQNGMPALRSMEMEKITAFFGFAREMMSGSKHNESYDLSQGRMSVHPYQAKGGMPPGQVTQLLKEAGVAPEKISAILTSAARAINSHEIRKPDVSVSGRDVHPGIKAAAGMEAGIAPEKISAILTSAARQKDSGEIRKLVSDLKKDAAISDSRATAVVKNSDQTGAGDKITGKNNVHTSIESHQQIDKILTKIENGGMFHKNLAGRQGVFYDGIAGMDKPQTAASGFGDGHGLATVSKNMQTLQNMPLPGSVMNQVGKEIASFIQRGDRFFTLQLKPPELGMVNIEMDVKENLLKMSIVTETGSAKDLLQANYANLRRVLEGYGVKVESFDIQLSSSLNQSATNGESPLNQQNHHSGRFGKKTFSTGQTEENDSEPPPAPQQSRDGQVDLLA
jgi:predicted RNA binding protein YcfA (HicA-like mRNA interferase family)